MRRNSCVLAALGLALLVPAFARAANQTFRHSGNIASVNVSTSDGCITNWIDVFFTENQFQEPPGPQNGEPVVQVYVSRYDTCQEIYLLDAFGRSVTPADAFHMSGLQSARLSTTLDAFDTTSGATIPIVIDLTWNGAGDVSHGHSSSWAKQPTYSYRSRDTGHSRYADAGGSIVVGGLSLTVPTTPWGYLRVSSGGMVFIQR